MDPFPRQYIGHYLIDAFVRQVAANLPQNGANDDAGRSAATRLGRFGFYNPVTSAVIHHVHQH